MMQGTGAAFQAQVSLNQQATDPMSHTPVQGYANLSGSYSLPAKSDGRSPCGGSRYRRLERTMGCLTSSK
jgi:hypothetical protein